MTEQPIYDLSGMSDAEIAKATREGRLDAILSGDPFGVQAARAEVIEARAAHAEVVRANAEAAAPEPRPVPVDQGARGGQRVTKYDEAWLATASAEEITKATLAGHLAKLL